MKYAYLPLALVVVMALMVCAVTGCRARQQESSGSGGGKVLDSGAAPGSAVSQPDTLKIAYNHVDSLDPYKLYSTMNQNIVALLYDPLVKLDRDYQPHCIVAREVTLNGLTCTVSLRDGLQFSDGSPVTAQDVVYSAQQVRVSTSMYKGQLSNVTAVAAAEDGTVVFTLEKPDWLFVQLLTFPIVKQEAPGIGSGRFVAVGSQETLALQANPRWYGGTDRRIQTVELVNQLDKDTLIYSLKLGTIHYAYADQGGGESLSLGISTQELPLNQMVYLGMNSTRAVLAPAQMRKAIHLAVDREKLANQTYGSGATAAYTPFNPRAKGIAPAEYASQRDLAAAQTLMEEIGYQEKDAEGYYVTPKGRLRMRLLVNTDNTTRAKAAEEIRQDLAELGIEVTVEEQLFDQYKTTLAGWDFDLYLGKARLYDNMDITFLISPKGPVGFGLDSFPALLTANDALMAGTLSTKDFSDVFYEYTPFVPLMYRSAAVAYSRDSYFDAQPTEQDIFYHLP